MENNNSRVTPFQWTLLAEHDADAFDPVGEIIVPLPNKETTVGGEREMGR